MPGHGVGRATAAPLSRCVDDRLDDELVRRLRRGPHARRRLGGRQLSGRFVLLFLLQGFFLDTFSVVFRTLLHASTMSQTIPDIHGYSQIFAVSEGMSF